MWQWVKNHPYITGLGILAIGILVFVVTRSGGSQQIVTGSTGPSEALQAANLQAQSHAADTQAQVNAQQSELNAALAAKSIDAATALATVQAQRDVALQQVDSANKVAQTNADALVKAATLQSDSQNIASQIAGQIAGVQSKAATDIAGIQSDTAKAGYAASTTIAGIQANVQLAGISAQLAALRDTNATALAINSNDDNLAWHVNDNSTKVSLTGLADALQLGLDNNQTLQFITQSNNDTSVILNGQNTSSSNYQATLNYNFLTHKSDNDTTVSLAGIAATLGIAGLQAGVNNNFIDSSREVSLAGFDLQNNILNVNAALVSHDQNETHFINSNVLNLIGAQGLNKSSSIEALGLITGNPSVSIASIQGSAAVDFGANFAKYTLPSLASAAAFGF